MSRYLALSLFVAMSGCAVGAALTPDRDVTLAVGEQASLPDASLLRYTGIANDSRCPVDVQCIRAGDADIVFDYQPAYGAPSRITLNSERTLTAELGAWRLRVVSLAPGERPDVTLRLQAKAGAP